MGGMGKKSNNYILCQNFGILFHGLLYVIIATFYVWRKFLRNQRRYNFSLISYFSFFGMKIKYIKSQINSLVSSGLDISFIS